MGCPLDFDKFSKWNEFSLFTDNEKEASTITTRGIIEAIKGGWRRYSKKTIKNMIFMSGIPI